MDYKFTADMENNLDDVADGKLVWTKVLGKFWKDFNPLVEKLDKTIVTKEIMDEHMKELGVHPKSGNKIVVTMARYGPVVKMTDKDNPNAVLYAPIKAPLTLEKITLTDAVELFEFPKKLGRYQSKIVSLQRGKYGYYLMIGTTPKTAIKIALKITDEEVNSFTIEKAISAIEEKSTNEFWKGSDSKNRYIVLEGQYGKYISIKPLVAPKTKKTKAQNVKLPADVDPETLTVDKVAEIIANYNTNRRKKKEEKVDKGCKDEKTKVIKAKKDETTKPKKKSTSTNSIKSKKSDLFDVQKQKKTTVKKVPVKKEKESTPLKKVTKNKKE
jgi:DNA topoisomerase-1